MSYTESHLLPGEQVKYQAHLHWFPFLPAYVVGILFTILAGIGLVMQNWWVAIAGAVIAIPTFVWLWITKSTSEFCVTDKRVVIKVGFIQRRTLETLLGKVETIGVEQSLLGRMLDFGTIVVTGTGGTHESFHNIASPLEFRRQVQAEVSAQDSDEDDDDSPARARDERECPYCAEMILKKARVCKHCGRDVEPMTT
ncbi:MAG TPA: PH domain-containing protein [Gemmatimonadaceae bacterium]